MSCDRGPWVASLLTRACGNTLEVSIPEVAVAFARAVRLSGTASRNSQSCLARRHRFRDLARARDEALGHGAWRPVLQGEDRDRPRPRRQCNRQHLQAVVLA